MKKQKNECEYCGSKSKYKIYNEDIDSYIFICEYCYEMMYSEQNILSETEEF